MFKQLFDYKIGEKLSSTINTTTTGKQAFEWMDKFKNQSLEITEKIQQQFNGATATANANTNQGSPTHAASNIANHNHNQNNHNHNHSSNSNNNSNQLSRSSNNFTSSMSSSSSSLNDSHNNFNNSHHHNNNNNSNHHNHNGTHNDYVTPASSGRRHELSPHPSQDSAYGTQQQQQPQKERQISFRKGNLRDLDISSTASSINGNNSSATPDILLNSSPLPTPITANSSNSTTNSNHSSPFSSNYQLIRDGNETMDGGGGGGGSGLDIQAPCASLSSRQHSSSENLNSSGGGSSISIQQQQHQQQQQQRTPTDKEALLRSLSKNSTYSLQRTSSQVKYTPFSFSRFLSLLCLCLSQPVRPCLLLSSWSIASIAN